MAFGRFFSIFTVAVLATVAFAPATWADTASLGASSDTWLRDGFSNDTTGPDVVLNARSDGSFSFVTYIQFDLSGLNIADVTDATLSVWKLHAGGSRNDTITTGRFAAHGLNDVAGNTLQHWDESADFDLGDATDGLDFRNVGAEWTNAGFGIDLARVTDLDQEGGASTTETIGPGDQSTQPVEVTLTGPDLVSFLNTRADDNGLVTFLLNIEQNSRGYAFASKENANSSLHPKLDLVFTSVPEPSSIAMLALASLALIGSRQRKA